MEGSTFDAEFLFSNFDSASETPNELEDSHSVKVKKLKKNLKKSNNEDIEESGDVATPQDKYISELEQQNAKLKSIIKRMIGPQIFSMKDAKTTMTEEINLIQKLEDDIQSKPFAVVLFLNNDVSTVHRKEIDDVMKSISSKTDTQEVLMVQKLQAQNSAVPIKAFTANFKGRRCNPGKVSDTEDPYVVCACQYYKSFYIDRMGAPLLESNPGITDIWDVPAYQQIFLKALPIVEEALNVRVKQLKQCFNCGGEHHLSECPEPKDMNRIKQSRQQFSAKKFSSPSGFDSRYHGDELDERFKHFKAGQISVGLEEALGIALQKQLPPYIYKMRSMGYPPAWMKPADEGLKMYGAEGVLIDEPGVEEGEIKGIKLPDVINYPGFNAPLPEGVEDLAQDMCMQPFNPELADLDIAVKRARAMGHVPAEPVAKRLKYEDESDMEVENEPLQIVEGRPPLPLIEVVSNSVQPPQPKEENRELTNVEEEEKATEDSEKEKGKLEISNIKKKPGLDETTPIKKSSTKPDGSVSLPRVATASKRIDETTYRNWYIHQPLTSIGITYVMYTPPPTCRGEVDFKNLPKNPITDLDREPWKTASVSWYDPLYGDLAAPTGTYDAIRTLLKETKREKRKPML